MTTDPSTQPSPVDEAAAGPSVSGTIDGDTFTPAEAPATGRGKGAYLHALPPGWVWTVRASGPGGAAFIDQVLDGEDRPDGQPVRVRFQTSGQEDERVSYAESFTEAVKTVSKGVKVMAKIAETEAAAEKARQEALDVLGGAPKGRK